MGEKQSDGRGAIGEVGDGGGAAALESQRPEQVACGVDEHTQPEEPDDMPAADRGKPGDQTADQGADGAEDVVAEHVDELIAPCFLFRLQKRP